MGREKFGEGRKREMVIEKSVSGFVSVLFVCVFLSKGISFCVLEENCFPV